jgi:hypothetical protein
MLYSKISIEIRIVLKTYWVDFCWRTKNCWKYYTYVLHPQRVCIIIIWLEHTVGMSLAVHAHTPKRYLHGSGTSRGALPAFNIPELSYCHLLLPYAHFMLLYLFSLLKAPPRCKHENEDCVVV